MKQMTLAAGMGFEKLTRPTRKTECLSRVETLKPWPQFCALIEPHYPKAGKGRPPVDLERMLRMCCIANCFNLADEDEDRDARPASTAPHRYSTDLYR